MVKTERQKAYRKKHFFVFVGIGITLILSSLAVLQYHFEIAFFALENYRNYFFTCDTALLPSPSLDLGRVQSVCIRDYLFDSHFIREGIAITILLSSGIGMIIYAPYQYMKKDRKQVQ